MLFLNHAGNGGVPRGSQPKSGKVVRMRLFGNIFALVALHVTLRDRTASFRKLNRVRPKIEKTSEFSFYYQKKQISIL